MMVWNSYLFPILLLDALFCRFLLVQSVNNGCNLHCCSSNVYFFSEVVFCWMYVFFDYLPCVSAYPGFLAFWKHSPTWPFIAQLARDSGAGQDQFWNAGSPRSLSAFCWAGVLWRTVLGKLRRLHPVGQPALLDRNKNYFITLLNSILL